MLNINEWIRQGDVIITRVGNNNDNKRLNKLGSNTVAYGEMTGHHHSFTRGGDQVLLYGSVNNNPELLEIKSESALLTHQEHDAIEIPSGLYKIESERNYDYWTNAVKKVVD